MKKPCKQPSVVNTVLKGRAKFVIFSFLAAILVGWRLWAGALANMVSSATDIAIEKFVLKDLLEGNGVVVALLDIEFTVKRTGKRVTEVDAVQIWRFNETGQVTHFRQHIDTHQQQLAWEA